MSRTKQRHRRVPPRRPSTSEVQVAIGADQVDLLEDIRDLMKMILVCAVCPHCRGIGYVDEEVIDTTKGPDGTKIQVKACECRVHACGLLAELAREDAEAMEEEVDGHDDDE